MTSVKKNIFLNIVNTVTGLIFPVITFPYAARVLMPEGIGVVNFMNSIISYIVLFTSLGIPMYAVKEVASVRDNIRQRSIITIELTLVSLILCIFGYIAVWFIGNYIDKVHANIVIFYILSLALLFNSIGVNWFYQAIEDFKFITIRALIVRALSACSLFLFVKSEQDLWIYALIVVGSSVGNNIINFINLKNYIVFQDFNWHSLSLVKHIRPTIQVFVLNLIVSLYAHLNTIMLGFMCNETEVGYYSAGIKLSHIGLTLIASIGTVLLPRCSFLIGNGENDKFASVINKSLMVTLLFSLPLCMGLIVLAKPVTLVFCGDDYLPSINVLCLNAPVIILISITNVLGLQILYPKGKLRIVILSVFAGAAINILLNCLLTTSFGAKGTAISVLCAESVVLLVQVILGKSYFPFSLKSLLNVRYFLATLIMAIIMLPVLHYVTDIYMQLLVGITTGIFIYATSLIIMKDDIALDLAHTIKKTIYSYTHIH